MVNIKPTINVYDAYSERPKLSKEYNRAISKMIDQTYDIDLEQFDFNEVAKGKCKEFDDLVTKLCAKSGLGSADIYSILLERFIAEYDMDYDINYVYGLDELEESKKTTKRSLKESHHSVRFEDFLMLNTDESITTFKIYINNDLYGSYYKDEIFNQYTELLQYDILEWFPSSSEKRLVVVYLK